MLKVTNLTGGYLGHPVLKELNLKLKKESSLDLLV